MYTISPDGDEIRRIARVGSDSPIVARTFVQTSRLMDAFGLPIDPTQRADLLQAFMKLQARLLACKEIAEDLSAQYSGALADAARGGPHPGPDGVAYTPHIIDLQ